jgi:hypothetical protein
MEKNPRPVRRNPIVSLLCLQRTLLSHLLPPERVAFTPLLSNLIVYFNIFTLLTIQIHIMAKFNFAAFLVALSLGEILENAVVFCLADTGGVGRVGWLVGWG